MAYSACIIQNHIIYIRNTELCRLERTTRGHLLLDAGPVTAGCTGPSPVKLEYLQGWWCHSVSWQPGSEFDHPQGNFISLCWIGISHISTCDIPSPLVMSLYASARSLVPSSLHPLIRQLQAAISFHLHHLFPRLCKPSSLNFLYTMLRPPSCLGASARLAPLFQYLSCTGKTRAGDIAPDAVSQVPERRKLSGPSICQQCSC